MKEKRIIVVSNRLPLKVVKENGEYKYTPTSGGLVTGLNCAKETMNFVWVGCLDGIPEEDQDKIKEVCEKEYQFIPVFVEKERYSKYYNNFCNEVLWPILHSFGDLCSLGIEDYLEYKQVNRMFCNELLKLVKKGDILWVHDYHLMLLPEMVKEKVGDQIKIGFFLHIPFPDISVIKGFSLLGKLISGLLKSDLIAFHTFEYLGNFRNACGMFNEAITTPFSIQTGSHTTRIEALPIGIDPALFLNESMKEATKKRAEDLKRKLGNRKIILGIDRVDYIKGIPHRIKAFSKLLSTHPDLAKKVVFCQVGVPSRMDVPVYDTLAQALYTLSGSLNSTGNIEDTNVYFINNSVTFSELCSLYLASDVCVVSSLRDGMNLVSLEFISCAGSGALVMSDYAGATGMLIGAITANPWNINELSQAYQTALSLPEDQRIQRKTMLQKIVSQYTASNWATTFISYLKE
ncbi:trehalose 6-phosphate synthase [Nematocida sp. AWRm80]|nr:trehalose 6-phosphate synthase [Nematocida sp. AWRm80]